MRESPGSVSSLRKFDFNCELASQIYPYLLYDFEARRSTKKSFTLSALRTRCYKDEKQHNPYIAEYYD